MSAPPVNEAAFWAANELIVYEPTSEFPMAAVLVRRRQNPKERAQICGNPNTALQILLKKGFLFENKEDFYGTTVQIWSRQYPPSNYPTLVSNDIFLSYFTGSTAIPDSVNRVVVVEEASWLIIILPFHSETGFRFHSSMKIASLEKLFWNGFFLRNSVTTPLGNYFILEKEPIAIPVDHLSVAGSDLNSLFTIDLS